MSIINLNDYAALNSYVLIADNCVREASVGTNGMYGYNSAIPVGSFFNGGIFNDTNLTDAQNDRALIANAINNFTVTGSIPTTTQTGIIPAYTAGVYKSSGPIDYNNAQLTFTGSSTDQFFMIATSNISFTGIISYNLLGGVNTNNIFWLGNGDIEFQGSTPTVVNGVFISNNNITFNNTNGSEPSLKGRIYTAITVTFNGPVSTYTLLYSASPVPCFRKGTKILTINGYVCVENISISDKLLSYGNLVQEGNTIKIKNLEETIKSVKWIGSFKTLRIDSDSRPICITKGTFGENCPFEDLYVSPKHGVIVNGLLNTAESLVNDKTIYQVNDNKEVEYYHIELDAHSVIIANGLYSETYVDNDHRHVFTSSNKNIEQLVSV